MIVRRNSLVGRALRALPMWAPVILLTPRAGDHMMLGHVEVHFYMWASSRRALETALLYGICGAVAFLSFVGLIYLTGMAECNIH